MASSASSSNTIPSNCPSIASLWIQQRYDYLYFCYLALKLLLDISSFAELLHSLWISWCLFGELVFLPNSDKPLLGLILGVSDLLVGERRLSSALGTSLGASGFHLI